MALLGALRIRQRMLLFWQISILLLGGDLESDAEVVLCEHTCWEHLSPNSPGEASTNNGMGCGDLRHVVVLSFANID